jgi:hypothetical protein
MLVPVLLLGGCVATPTPPSVESVATLPSGSAAPSASGTPSATPSPPSAEPSPVVLAFDDLPEPETDDTTRPLAVCQPVPGQALPDGGDDLVGCGEGIEIGLRAIRTATTNPFDRVLLVRPTCAVAPCSEEALATGTVVAWNGRAWQTSLDFRTRTATAPTASTEPWPSAEEAAPAIKRPAIDGAPAEVARREPLPFCGAAEVGEPPAVNRCFLAAMFAGRPAEMIETLYGTEGGTVHVVIRFLGSGPIVTYQNGVDAQARPLPWYRQLDAAWLAPDGVHWSPTPLTKAVATT